ncbi:MAG TPA: tetratricopeptide repeat protein, partial [Kofleriaceae bacterium]|nr:tetratricopeptide repeat protein [Kofleriaceae bacterium]
SSEAWAWASATAKNGRGSTRYAFCSVAKRGLAAWPHSIALRVEAARVEVAQGHLTDAIEGLPDALIAKDPAAVAVRARARLLLDDVDGARRDLELVAAASSPDLRAARALLGAALGEAVEPPGPSERPDLRIVEARLARQRGEPAKAVAALRPLLETSLGMERFPVRLELARAYRDSADYPGARSAYNELMSVPNPQLRLETAQLLLEDSDPKRAREHIEALLRDEGDRATGAMLVEAMRIRTLTGAPTQAESLAAKAAAAGAPPWMLQREAARIARQRDDLGTAAEALGKALDGSKADLDTLLMACDVIDSASPTLVAKLNKAVDERLADQPDLLVAQGKLALSRGDVAKASELFDKAAQRFKERPVSARRLAQVSFGAGALAVGRKEWVMARRKLEAAIEFDPSLLDAYTYLAVALARGGDLPRAVGLLKTAAELAPESVLVWQTLADYATNARDGKTAAEASKRAATLLRRK